jgi:hypothetical protein
MIAKALDLADVSLGEFLTMKYAVWLDLRTTDDDQLHGSGRHVENASEGVTIQMAKRAEAAGTLNVYLYILMDAQLNIEDGRFVSALYKSSFAAPQRPPLSYHLWTVRMRKNSIHPRPAGGPLSRCLPARCGPLPYDSAQ